mgnify:CR=1 FL=1
MDTVKVYSFPSKYKPALSEVGGKGLSLMVGSHEGLPVPPGFILTVAFFKPWLSQLKTTEAWSYFLNVKEYELEKASAALKNEAMRYAFTSEQRQEISGNLHQYGQNTLFAVRSSSPEEDLEGSSFAGGYETVLGVTVQNMENAIKKAFVSCLDYRVAVYKRENGFDMKDPKIAVVVQQQIASDIAGVGFSLNPVTNNYDDAVFNANWGLGETVVAGIATPDTFVVDKISLTTKERTVGAKETSIWLIPSGGTVEKTHYRSGEPTLRDFQIIELTELLKNVEKLYGMPMDIEWAYAEDKLYLLQARPISVFVPLSPSMITEPEEKKCLYVDATISVQGIERPMSVAGISFLRTALRLASKTLFWRDMNRDITTAVPWIENGRIYINLSNAMKLAGKDRVVQIMQIFDPLVAKTIKNIDEKEYISRTNRLWLLPIGVIIKLPRTALHMYAARAHPERTHREVQEKLERFLDTARSLDEKESSFMALADKLMRTLGNDVFLNTVPLVFLGKNALGKMKEIAGKDLEDAFASFDVALPNNVTTEMGLKLYRISTLLPQNIDQSGLERGLRENTLPEPFITAWKDFIRSYGCRGPMELDIAAPRYRDDPALLLNVLLPMRNTTEDASPQKKFEQGQKQRHASYAALLEKIQTRSSRQAKRFEAYYKIFETFAGYRETHKLYLMVVIDIIRGRILLEAKNLYEAGRLKTIKQIFDLTLEDIDRAKIDVAFDLTEKAKNNTAFTNRLNRIPRLPTMIDSRGYILRPPKSPVREGEVAGTPISSGVIRGRIKVLHFADEKPLNKGEILVARTTDPGWTPLFVNAAAVILEIGGSLQHGALVAREYGLPCVAGIEHATSLWKDGTLVEVDGSTGIISVIGEK